ncbi:MAG: translation initiation factor IF-2 N-terminal domain-containing protein, partial [Acidobacteria bacterium]|nr:translation initiation factor IF-2 N-terminal domain-containing protein [Acidobacteriota bacterium]
MGKIPIQDLARMMGIPHQDLMFKLKSIGVRVEGDDAQIDTDTLQAILQGKRLPHPREVILRDDESSTPGTPVRRPPVPPARRPPANPLRPARPRTVIQRVEPRIKSLPVTERAQPAPAPVAEAPPPVETPVAKTAPETTAAPEPAAKPPATIKKVAETPAPSREDAVKTTPATAPTPAKPQEASPEKDRVRQLKRTSVSKDPVQRQAPAGSMVPSTTFGRRRPGQRPKPGRRRPDQRREPRPVVPEKKLEFKEEAPQGPVLLSEGMTVREFAEKLGVKSKDLIQALFRRGVMANINNVLSTEL